MPISCRYNYGEVNDLAISLQHLNLGILNQDILGELYLDGPVCLKLNELDFPNRRRFLPILRSLSTRTCHLTNVDTNTGRSCIETEPYLPRGLCARWSQEMTYLNRYRDYPLAIFGFEQTTKHRRHCTFRTAI